MLDVEEHPRYEIRHFESAQYPLPALAPPAATTLPIKSVGKVKVPDNESRAWRCTLQQGVTFPINIETLDMGAVAGRFGDRAICTVRWGTENGKHEAIIDWKAGTTFVVHGSEVEIFVTPPPTMNAGGFLGTIDSIMYRASISPDSGGREQQAPTCTFYTGTIHSAEFSPSLPVPRFARRMRWLRVVDTSAPAPTKNGTSIGVAWSQDSAFVALCGFETTDTGSLNWPGGIGLTIPPEARFVSITNNDPAADIGLYLEFDLDLG